MQLRDFQRAAIDSIYDYFSNHSGNPIIVAATGAGKSVIIGKFVQEIFEKYPNQKILMVTHVKELIRQNYLKLMNFWPAAPAGIYSAGLGKKQHWQPIVFGGVQSTWKKASLIGWRDLLIIDECHLLSPKHGGQYVTLINELKKINPKLKVIGFTATPWRLKGGHLINQEPNIFTDICFSIGMKELINKGFLSPLKSKSSAIQADLSKVRSTAGEFNLKQLEEAINIETLTKAALDEIEILAKDRKYFLFFCSGVKHANRIADELRKRNWDASTVTCKTPKAERDKLLEDFKNSEHRVALINNAVLTTGVDLPRVDCIVLLRGTKSSVLYLQILGRGMRLAEGKKDCLVLDYAGNIERFGAADLIDVSDKKSNNGKKKTIAGKIVPQKICPQCREPVIISATRCPGCDFEFALTISHSTTASSAAILSEEEEITEHEITKTTYFVGTDKNGNKYLKIIHFDEWGKLASEFVHFAYKKNFNYHWWSMRWNLEAASAYPNNAEEALELKEYFYQLSMIRTLPIKINGKSYLKVVGWEKK